MNLILIGNHVINFDRFVRATITETDTYIYLSTDGAELQCIAIDGEDATRFFAFIKTRSSEL